MDPIDQIKAKIDIVDLISEYFPLKKMGRNFATLCPFHKDTKPSFMVSPDRQIFRCFSCLPKGELVKTSNGLHSIDQVEVGDLVVSGKGKLRRVVLKHERFYDGRIVNIKVRKLGGKVTLTENHQVFVLQGAPYTQVFKNLSRRIRKYGSLPLRNYHAKLAKYFAIKKIPAGELTTKDYLLYPINTSVDDLRFLDLGKFITRPSNSNPMKPKPISLKLTINDNLLKILGYWIAEGSTGQRYIRFSLGPTEKEFAYEIRRILKDLFGVDASLHGKKEQSGIDVICSHVLLANIFENLCGRGAANKHIPFELERITPEKQKIIIDALVKGDGRIFKPKISPNLRYSITTASQILAEQVRDILLRCGLFPSVSIIKARIDKNEVSHKRFFRISWTEEGESKYKLKIFDIDGTCYWILPIRSLAKRKFTGNVYNLTVEKDHSYVANNFAVGNCEAKGDIFGFIQQREGLTFRESLELLAKKAGVTLPKFDKKARDDKERVFEINNLAAKLYHHILLNTRTGAIARKYLQDRKIDKTQWGQFYLGFAPTQSILEKFLTGKGFNLAEIAQSGLLIAGGPGNFFDRFKNRIIFPIFSVSGAIVGFSGRSVDDVQEPKYLNSPETIVFQKGGQLYGLNLAKEAIRSLGFAILVEGEFDVIASHQAGCENVVAVKGTSLTEDQIKLICRFSDQISICFDTDLAGDAAARRGIELADRAGLSIKVIRLTGAKDPDEAVKKSAKFWKKAIEDAVPVYDWLIEEAFRRYDRTTPYGAKKITDELVPAFVKISDEVVRAHYFQKLANKLRLVEVSLWEKAAKISEKGSEFEQQPDEALPKAANRQKSLSEYFLALVLQGSKFVKSRKYFPEVNFIYPDLINFYQEIIMSNLGRGDFDLKVFTSSLTGENLQTLDNLLFLSTGKALESEAFFEAELKKVAKSLATVYYKEKVSQILLEIKDARNGAKNKKSAEKLNFLLQQLANLKKE